MCLGGSSPSCARTCFRKYCRYLSEWSRSEWPSRTIPGATWPGMTFFGFSDFMTTIRIYIESDNVEENSPMQLPTLV